ncbi:hypothetical protein [Qipengyuania citrea]|uniref:hypothetical protein n=1 Tax=Qipengyuania citrea TaxID=225971 RepID=UPI00329886A9
MSITFSIRSDAKLTAKPAPVTARQLAAFRAFARQHGQLIGVYDDEDFGYLAYGFEARVCPWSWATIAGIFGDSEGVIAVVEEAQFEGLNVRFWKDTKTAAIMMGVATSADGTRDMSLANANAYALLDALGAPRDPCGDLDLPDLLDAINDPATRRHLERQGMATYLEQLDAMTTAPASLGKRLVWA